MLWLFVLGLIKTDFNQLSIGIVETVTLRGISTLWFLPSLFLAFVLRDYLQDFKVVNKETAGKVITIILMIMIPMISIELSVQSFIHIKNNTSPVYNICLTLLKGLVAFWFLEVGYIAANKLISLPVAAHAAALGGGQYLLIR